MKNKLKRLLSGILALAMTMTMLPTMAFAEDPAPNYLTFTAQEANSSVTFSWVDYANESVMCNVNGSGWERYWVDEEVKLENVGDFVQFRGTNVTTDLYHHFTMTGTIAASGSVTSLTDGTGADSNVTLTEKCYSYMFYNCANLTTAPELPATTLANNCYQDMFYNCANLTTAPALPATTLAIDCYSAMFLNCSALTTAPALPATTLAKDCYSDMFSNCSALTTAPALPATTLAESCYMNMFEYCRALTTAPELPATTLAKNCYTHMFDSCSALTTAPALPATTLANNCYYGMFQMCSKLTTAPELPATTLANNCYFYMFSGCRALTTAPALPATTLAERCYEKMFGDCSTLTTAPELPATTLANYCYSRMFSGCQKLTTAPALPATTLADYCYQSMFDYCKALTTAPELPATTLANYCYSRMFQNCQKLTTAPELPATTLANYCYQNMFDGCRALTTIPELPATTLANYCYQSMFNGCTNLNMVAARDATHNAEWKIPATTTTASNWNSNMFSGCTKVNLGGSNSKIPVLNTAYYQLGGTPPHEASTNYGYDETNHWLTCSVEGCTERFNEGVHVWNNGKCTVCEYVCTHTYGTVGEAIYTCTVCRLVDESRKPAPAPDYVSTIDMKNDDAIETDLRVTLPANTYYTEDMGTDKDKAEGYVTTYVHKDEENGMDIDLYVWEKDKSIKEDAEDEADGKPVTYEIVNGVHTAYYFDNETEDGVDYKTLTYLFDDGNYIAELVFWFDLVAEKTDAEMNQAALEGAAGIIASLTADHDYQDNVCTKCGDTITYAASAQTLGDNMTVTIGENTFIWDDFAADEKYLGIFRQPDADALDVDYYKWDKNGKTLYEKAQAEVTEANKTETVAHDLTIKTIKGVAVATYLSDDDEGYKSITAIFDGGDYFAELVFFYADETEKAQAEAIINSVVGYFTVSCNGEIAGKYAYGETCILSASSKQDWTVNGVKMATTSKYTFTVLKNTDVTSTAAEDEAQPITIVATQPRVTSGTKQTMSFTNQWTVPAKYNVVEAGLIYRYGNANTKHTVAQQKFLLENYGVTKTYTSTAHNGTYKLNLSLSKSSYGNREIYAKSYIIVTDGNETWTIYSEMIAVNAYE